MPKISIIVPIFNVEKYLSRCLDSLLNQTFKDIEIILVNDGSTDSSLSICKKYAEEDNRIHIINKENGGVSSARNEGIRISSGDYIGFVDPDDWIEIDMYEVLYNRIMYDRSDIAICNYKMVYPQKNESVVYNDFNDQIIEKKDITNRLIANLVGPENLNSKSKAFMGSVWRLLIKKSIIKNGNIQFPIGIPLMEDTIFTLTTIVNSTKVSVIKGSYYNYIVNLSSAATSYRNDLDNIQKSVHRIIEDALFRSGDLESLKNRLNYRYFNDSINLIRNEIKKDNNIYLVSKIRNIRNICCDSRLQYIIEGLDYSGFTLRKKTTIFLIKYKLAFLIYLYYTSINILKI